MSAAALSWPLTGRSEEIRILQEAIASAEFSGAVICGAAGVGKSRIARDGVSATVAPGSDVRWAVCTSAAQAVPLGAFAAWTPSGATDTVQLLRGVVESLTASSSGSAVIGVDDVHLIDELSAFVVHQIVQRRLAKVILTVREGESIPAVVHEIFSAGRFERMDLLPLSPDETAQLLSAALEGPVDSQAVQRLWRRTAGNVLYLRNIVEHEVAHGRIVQRSGYWRWVGDPIIPAGLTGLIESRIGALPGPLGDVIDVLAVGEPIELTALTRITDRVAVEEAETRGLISIESKGDDAQVRLAHPLYGEVRRERAPTTRLRRLRGLVAAELAASEDRSDVAALVRRATLTVESDLAPEADLLARAAQGAVWLADLPLADRLAQAAIRAGAGPESSFVRAHALSWLGRGEEADRVLAEVPSDNLDEGERGRLAFLRASNMLWALGDPVRARAIVDDASHTTASQARGYIDAFLAVYWFATDQPAAARRASDTLDLTELPPVVGAEIAWVRAAIAADDGRMAEALAVADAGYAVVARARDAPQMMFNIADAHVSALLLAGCVDQAVDVAERAGRRAIDLPGAAPALGAAVAGRAALAAGRLDSACLLLDQAATAFADSGHAAGWGYRYLIPSITALAMRGSTDAAAAALDALNEVRRPFRLLDYEKSLAASWVAAAQGSVTEAISIAVSAAERARANGQFAAEVMCLQTAAQFGDGSCALRLLELEGIVEGPRAGIAARFAAALRESAPVELAATSQEFEQIGDLVAAADAAAHAAQAYRCRDQRGTALGCATRAAALAELCCGLDTPALRQATEPLPLTDREREVVMLIGLGLSNRAVAERLTLSVRTVESHIYRAMLKTGTTNREELAALRPRRLT